MIGPFKPVLGGFRYLYVTIDKFSKWIEYKPRISATVEKAVELFEDIIHRFSLSNSIITDLSTTFTGHHFWDFCEDRCISVKYVSVAHPRANGQVERANDMILDALKKRLYQKEERHPGRWLKELPAVVWGLRTQASHSMVYLHTSWSMAQKPYYQRILPSEHLRWKIMMKSRPQLFG